MKKALFVCVLAMLLLPMVSLAKILPPLEPYGPDEPESKEFKEFVDWLYPDSSAGGGSTGGNSGTSNASSACPYGRTDCYTTSGLDHIDFSFATQWEELWWSQASKPTHIWSEWQQKLVMEEHLGWIRTNVDLNKGAGGNYIYMYYCLRERHLHKGIPSNDFITDICFITGKSSTISAPAGYYKINVDLNRGAGGDYIYMCVRYQSGGAPIKALVVVAASKAADAKAKCPKGYTLIDTDLNKGAGGDYIYLCYLK